MVVVHGADAHGDVLGGADVEPGLVQQPLAQIEGQELGGRDLGDALGEDAVLEEVELEVVQAAHHAGRDALVEGPRVQVIVPADVWAGHGREHVAACGDVVPEAVDGVGPGEPAAHRHHRDIPGGLGPHSRRPVALGLLDDDVVVHPAEAAGGDGGHAPAVGEGRPGACGGGDDDVVTGVRRLGGELLEARHVGEGGVLHGHHGLDQARHPGGGLEMADLVLDGAQQQGGAAPGVSPVGLVDGVVLHRVAHDGGGGVGLEELDLVGSRASPPQGCLEGAGAAGHRGGVDRLPRAVARGADAPDDRADVTTVGDGVLEALEHHDAGALADDQAVGAVVEGVGVPGDAQTLHLGEAHVDARVGAQITAPGDHHLRVARAQGLAGHVDGGKGAGAGAVHRHVVAVDPEDLCHAVRDRRRHVAHRRCARVPAVPPSHHGGAELGIEGFEHGPVHAGVLEPRTQLAEVAVAAQVGGGVGEAVDPRGADDGDALLELRRAGLDARVLEGGAGGCEGDQLGWVHALEGLGRQPVLEEGELDLRIDERAQRGVSRLTLGPIARREALHVPQVGRHGLEVGVPIQDVLPVARQAGGGGEDTTHADDGDVVAGHALAPVGVAPPLFWDASAGLGAALTAPARGA